MTRLAHALYFSASALWVGGLATISFVVAPVAFRTLLKEEAGQTVGAVLRAFGWIEIACGVIALAAAVVLARGKSGRPWEKLRVGILLVMLSLTGTNVGWVYNEAAKTRGMLRTSDPALRERFAFLHRLSVILVATNILIGGAQLVVSAAKLKPADGP